MTVFFQALLTQKHVVGALLLREITARWGRRNLGFAWLFAEPLVFAFPVLIMWSIINHGDRGGLAIIPFMWSGYLPLLMFRHTTGHCIYAIRQNAALLYHRSVTPFDLMMSKIALELIGSVAALVFSFIVFYALDEIEWPKDIPLFLMGVMYMAWWSFAVALTVGALSERTELIHHVWPPISYIYMPISGFVYLAVWLPPSARDLALTVMPSLHAYEMIRGGLFGSRIEVFYNVGYLSAILATLTAFGLWALHDVRRHLEFE